MRRLGEGGVGGSKRKEAMSSRAPGCSVPGELAAGIRASAVRECSFNRLARLAFTETKEPLSHDCRSHGPISPMEGCAATGRENSAAGGSIAPPAMPGISIPAMSIPSIAISRSVELVEMISAEWQSESASANAQERSQAAAMEETASSNVTAKPASVRLTIMPFSMLRQSRSRRQIRSQTQLERRGCSQITLKL